jgi:glycosyltransferase involved in cell wall biosynthesis
LNLLSDNDGTTDESGLIIKAFRDKRIKSFHFEEKKGVSYRRQQLPTWLR